MPTVLLASEAVQVTRPCAMFRGEVKPSCGLPDAFGSVLYGCALADGEIPLAKVKIPAEKLQELTC